MTSFVPYSLSRKLSTLIRPIEFVRIMELLICPNLALYEEISSL